MKRVAENRLTRKQFLILEALIKGIRNEKDVLIGWHDIHTLAKTIKHPASRESLICSLNILTKRDFIQPLDRIRRNDRWVVCFMPTDKAIGIFSVKTRVIYDDGVVYEGF